MDSPLSRTWANKPDLIRGFYNKFPTHERLCDELEYILKRRIKALGIEISSISSRAKSLESFCEKIERKKYSNPLDEISDLSGVRVVFLYSSDRQNLEGIIENEFEIHEKVDKISVEEIDRFGYGALHYVVSLKSIHAGARYEDLRGIKCEIQVRTILQDAWAIVAHHLSYKHEENVPNELKRKLSALSGLFETADDQFERLKDIRLDYQNKIVESIKAEGQTSLAVSLNLDSLLAYITSKFPDRRDSSSEAVADLLNEIQPFGFTSLKAIDDIVNANFDAVLAQEIDSPPFDREDGSPTEYLGVGLIRTALEIGDERYRLFREEMKSNNISEE